MNSIARIQKNLRIRLRLLWMALARRNIWTDIMALARERDSRYLDVIGDVEPLSFARAVFGLNGTVLPALPDFTKQFGSPDSFTPPGAPHTANSENNVGRFLAQLVFHKKPAVVVEMGCLGGWTSAHLAKALQINGCGRLICVDCEQRFLDVTMANLKRLGLDGVVTTVRGTSMDPTVVAALPKAIDLFFLDTTHSYPGTLEEIKLYATRMAEGGCIVIHDAISDAGVRRSLADVAGKFRIFTFATEDGDGVSVLLHPAPSTPF